MKTISKKVVRERPKEMFAIVDRVLEWTPAKEVVAAAVVGKERRKKDGNHEVER